MDYNIKPWPRTSTLHELNSIVLFLSNYVHAPPEMRIREIESAFRRPMIQVSLLSQRVVNRSQFDFSVVKTATVTYFGSQDITEEQRHNEAWIASDWLAEAFGRGYGVHGPIIPIYDFHLDPPDQTTEWIEVESATAEPVLDQFNLWTVPIDLRYAVSRPEAEYSPETNLINPNGTLITDIKWRVELT